MTEILKTLWDCLLDSLVDTAKLVPFLFLTYLLMEYIEHKTSEKAEEKIRKAGRLGPVIGGFLGIVPQCGFSASAASLYSGRIITLGTLVAIFLSTSDEMLPILLSRAGTVGAKTIAEILVIKVLVAIIIGLGIDLIMHLTSKDNRKVEIHCLCEDDDCHCEEGSIFKSALHHSVHIVLFIFVVSFVLNTLIALVGEAKLGATISKIPILDCAVAALVGLIPNCAASVVITEMYIAGIIDAGAMMAGLLTGCGIGLLVLFRTNKKNLMENVKILLIMYFAGVIVGSMIHFMGITI